ncbi:hypothetical protein BOX15_Mlig008715g2 [Macrostomum lignano]|nr:hypothetical protein BOX15_Mlig008715g2 [Macrostomum lignano]
MRLLLRLGCEHRVYPCPLTSVRRRSPVFGELSRSLAGMLVDTKNFSHGLPSPPGLSVRLRTGCTVVRCPVEAYDCVQKALAAATSASCGAGNGSWVLAFGASFCPAADAHLVCHQNLETGEYGTRAISIEGRQLSITAASFVVFNGGGGTFAQNRASIVEDGVLVQLTDDQMARLRDALRSMRTWSAVCSAADSAGDLVEFVWQTRQDDDKERRTSPSEAGCEFSNSERWISLVDGQPLTGCRTIRLAPGGQRTVRCTRLHAIREGDLSEGSPADCLRWANRLAGAVVAAVNEAAEAASVDEEDPTDDGEALGGGCPAEFAVCVRAGLAEGASWTAGQRITQPALLRSLESALRPLLAELDRLLASELALELVFARLPAKGGAD